MNIKVLVVDDEELIRKTLLKVLQKAGIDVSVAVGGEEALQLIEKDENIQVFFLDLKMPGMDGMQLCGKLRQKRPSACIYALTAYASDYHTDQCREAGFDDIFTKPFNIQQIIQTINESTEKIERWTKTGKKD